MTEIVEALDELLDRCASDDPHAQDLVAQSDELVGLRRAIERLEGLWLARLSAFDVRGGYANDRVAEHRGVPAALTTTLWLRRACLLAPSAASERVRLARQLRRLPTTAAALMAGDLSYANAKITAASVEELREPLNNIGADSGDEADGGVPEAVDEALDGVQDEFARAMESLAGRTPFGGATEEDVRGRTGVERAEAILVRAGSALDPLLLRRAAVHLRQQVDPNGELDRAERAFERRALYVSPGLDRVHHLNGILDGEGAATLLTALNALCPAPEPGDIRSPAQRRADALVTLARLALDGQRLPRVAGERPHLNVIVSWETLVRGADGSPSEPREVREPREPGARGAAGGPRQGRPARSGRCRARAPSTGGVAELAFGGLIGPETARRLACDAGVARIVTDPKGLPLDAGRRVRVVPPHLRRALAARDRGCVYPGCDRPPEWCEAHHRWHWADGGPTSLDNTASLCPRHHRYVHEGRWQLPPALPARSALARGA